MNQIFRITLLAFTCALLAPAVHAASVKDKDGRFLNRYADLSKSQNVLKWKWDRMIEGLPKPAKTPTPQTPVNLSRLNNPQGDAQVTWIGHSSLLYQSDGKNFLFDPVYAEYASPVPPLGPKRAQDPGIPFADLPHIDAVFISHNHYDHLDLDTVRRLAQQAVGAPVFYVPLGVDQWFVENVPGARTDSSNPNVIAMDWDEARQLDGNRKPFTIKFLAVQHWAARTPFDRNKTLWGSWLIEQPGFRFWFGGDFGYSPDIDDIGKAHGGFDLAAIPIGAYDPRWLMKRAHINPHEAIETFKTVKAKRAIAIHWGTFEGLSDESLDQPPVALDLARKEANISPDEFMLFSIGETRSFNGAQR